MDMLPTPTDTGLDERPFDEDPIDEALRPFFQLVQGLAEAGAEVADPETGMAFAVEAMKVDIPIAMDVHVDDEGRVLLGSAPPTQHIETSVMPVFHRLKVRVVRTRE